MTVQFLLLPFFLYLLYSIITFRLSKRYKDVELQRLYKIGIGLKFFGGFSFFLIYKYYYVYGDTFGFYAGGQHLVDLFFKDVNGFFKFLFSPPANYDGIDNDEYGHVIYSVRGYFRAADNWLIIKLCAIANIFTFGSYLFSTFLFSSFSFYGLWKLFLVFDRRYPNLRNYIFFAVFCVPSVLFWGSGILKDTITIGCLGLVFFQFDKLFFRGKINLISIAILIIASMLILTLKGYILLAFIPALLLAMYSLYLSKIKGCVFKAGIGMVLLLVVVFGGSFLMQYFATVSQEFAIDRLTEVAEGFHSYHGRLHETGQAGSGYTLNISSYTLSGMIAVFPQAVNVTLFRPYIWEANSPVMLISSLESMVIILFTLWVIYKQGVLTFLRSILEPFASMCLLYSIILGFAIGITAFNFGALVRFKIPLVPFFVIGLLIIHDQRNRKKKAIPDSP